MRMKETRWLVVGLVPTMSKEYMPGLSCLPRVTVSVDDPPVVTEGGLKVAVSAGNGRVVTLRAMVWGSPWMIAVDTVALTDLPGLFPAPTGLSEIEKSLGM